MQLMSLILGREITSICTILYLCETEATWDEWLFISCLQTNRGIYFDKNKVGLDLPF